MGEYLEHLWAAIYLLWWNSVFCRDKLKNIVLMVDDNNFELFYWRHHLFLDFSAFSYLAFYSICGLLLAKLATPCSRMLQFTFSVIIALLYFHQG